MFQNEFRTCSSEKTRTSMPDNFISILINTKSTTIIFTLHWFMFIILFLLRFWEFFIFTEEVSLFKYS